MTNEPTATTRPPRRKTTRHPLLAGRARGVWHPDLVGKVPGYPATAEGFERRQEAARKQARAMNANGQRGTRKGVPDGWAGRREEIAAARIEAAEKGRRIVAALIAQGTMDDHIDNLNGMRARLALEMAAAATVETTISPSDRLSAARTLLRYCRPIPLPAGGRVRGATAEEYLNAMVARSDGADEAA